MNEKEHPFVVELRCSKPLTMHTKEPFMSLVNTFSLQSNKQIKINFEGGDLSSDAGLLLIKEFAAKIGFTKLIKKSLKPTIRLSGSTKTMKIYYR